MIKHILFKLKILLVQFSGIWFYPAQKLPVGTHFPLFLKHRVLELKVVLDIGANFGHFSREIDRYFSGTKFYCFEPFPQTFEKLKANLPESNFLKFQLALGDSKEIVKASQNESSYSDTNSLVKTDFEIDSADQIDIQVITLDDFLEENHIHNIDLLKIDTEGFDLKVLKGAEESLKKGLVKLIYVECGLDPSNTYHIFFPEILSYLNSLKYVFVGFFQTDIRKIDRKIHFSNALFTHESVSNQIKTF
jgi:FkbM family methyltransferase